MNKRKKIIISYSVLFSLILSILALRSYYFKNFSERMIVAYYPKITYHKEILEQTDHHYETLILGDSLGTFNIRSSEISDSTLNLSTFGATFVEVYASLLKYLKNNSTPQNIILLNNQNWDYKREHEFWPFYVGFGFLSLDDVLSIEYQESYPAVLSLIKWLYYKTGIPNYDLTQFRTSLQKGEIIEKYNRHLASKLKEDRGSVILKHRFPPNRPIIQPYHQQYQGEFKVNPTNDFYFKKLLQLTSEKKINVVMIDPPTMPSARKNENLRNFRQKMTEYHKEILKEFNYTYCEDNITQYDDNEFFDIDHLLEAGARKFSAFIKTCL